MVVAKKCLAERYKDEILKEIPEIDAVLGTTSYDSIVEAVNTALEEEKIQGNILNITKVLIIFQIILK